MEGGITRAGPAGRRGENQTRRRGCTALHALFPHSPGVFHSHASTNSHRPKRTAQSRGEIKNNDDRNAVARGEINKSRRRSRPARRQPTNLTIPPKTTTAIGPSMRSE